MNRSSSGSLTLGTDVTINSNAALTNGIIYGSTANYVGFTNAASYSGGNSDNSYVDGAVVKTGLTLPCG